MPEENLLAMNGAVVALQPPRAVYVQKDVDQEAGEGYERKQDVEIVAAGKKPTLGEVGFAPAYSTSLLSFFYLLVNTKTFSCTTAYVYRTSSSALCFRNSSSGVRYAATGKLWCAGCAGSGVQWNLSRSGAKW